MTVIDVLKDYMIRPKGMFMWRDVPGYEGRYQISNHGEVCSITNKIVSPDYTYAVLIRIDKTRQDISKKKLLKLYWPQSEHRKGEEKWKRLEYYGDYYISNYGNVKNCKRLVLWPTNGRVTLEPFGDNPRVTKTVLSIFLQTFPPYELEINEDSKEVNYKKSC